MSDNQEKAIGIHPNKRTDDSSKIVGKNYLLLIGISEYQDSKNISRLPNAVKDIQDFEKILLNKYYFEEKNIIKILNKDATSEIIHQKFDELIKIVKPEDSLIIYFSGHGDFKYNHGYWLPFESKTGAVNSYISNADLKILLDVFENSCRHIFLISDSCFSGNLFETTRKINTKIKDSEPSRYGLSSGKKDQVVYDGEAGTNSPFAKYLLELLENNDDSIGAEFLSRQVRDFLIENDGKQTPCCDSLNVKGHKHGQFVFHLRNEEDTVFANADTIKEINFYLAKYKPAKYRKEAKEKLRQLEIQEEFDNCRNRADYHDFIDDYPNHPLTVEAEKKIEEINAKTVVSKKIEKPVFTETSLQKPFETRLPFEPEMIEIPEGSFEMGSNEHDEDEKPSHRVELSNFAIGKFQITVEQYLHFVDETKSHYPVWLEAGNEYNIETGNKYHYKEIGYSRSAKDLPIVGVSWYDADTYCKWLEKKTGKNYRLPTEAQWEYAARGGDKYNGYIYSGSINIDEVAWHSKNSGGSPHSVGTTKKHNQLEIYDMTGNVWEWCNDWYDKNYYKNSPSQNPKGAVSGSYRVFRGGGCINVALNCRLTNRGGDTPLSRSDNVGFRIAVSLQVR